ncbi:MAG: TIGR02186 family protein [Beijerinckiaceae bacterium]
MTVLRFLAAMLAVILPGTTPASAERLITSISSSRVLISSSYAGTELVLFGAIERDGASVSRAGPYDLVVTVRGPASPMAVREKSRFGFIWVNADQQKYINVPGYLALLSSRPLTEVSSPELRQRFQLGLVESVEARGGNLTIPPERRNAFHAALIRLKKADGLFQEEERGVVFLAPNLFRVIIDVPATAPLGNYEATVTLFADGAPLATEKSDFEVVKTGFEARMAALAHGWPLLYGFATVLLAIGFGWVGNYAFRRD